MSGTVGGSVPASERRPGPALGPWQYGLLAVVVELALAWGPLPASATPPATRAEAIALYLLRYEAPQNVPSEWSGNQAACDAGDVSPAYLDASLQCIEYFRLMAGLPPGLALDASWNAKCQQAALMMAVNSAVSHAPPASWRCYTSAGAEAARNANLAVGFRSLPEAVAGWMSDEGLPGLGHRRWLLYPPLAKVGIGAVDGYRPTGHALWVAGGTATRPQQPEFVAWPPPGWVPYPVVYPAWSFSMAGAGFAAASVTMTQGATQLPVTLEPVLTGAGDNTLIWTPDGVPQGPPGSDTPYHVEVRNVVAGGQTRTFAYDVVIIDPSISPAPVNAAPLVADIPDQAVAPGSGFTPVVLDQYVTDADNADSEIAWTATGASLLTVGTTGRVASVGLPGVPWCGSETVTFTATDPAGAADSDTAAFTVLASPPVLSEDTLWPTAGDETTAFSFAVVYTSPCGVPPDYAYLVLVSADQAHGDQPPRRLLMSTADPDVVDGSPYVCSQSLPAGSYSHYCEFSAGGTVLQTPLRSGPSVEAPRSFAVSGSVALLGQPVHSGVTITFARVFGEGAIPAAVRTGPTGAWEADGFAPGSIYLATPDLAGWSFSPQSLQFGGATDALNFIGQMVTAVLDEGGASPGGFALRPNVPNPFNAATAVTFDLPAAGPVRLVIYALTGQPVEALLDGWRPAGRHTVRWEPAGLATGVYVCRLQAGGCTESRKMLLVR